MSDTNPPVSQSGTVTPGHPAVWTTSGVVQDGGTPTSPAMTGVGIQKASGTAVSISTAVSPSPYNFFGLGFDPLTGNAQIQVQNYNGAPAVGLQYIINGAVFPFPGSISGSFSVLPNIAALRGNTQSLTEVSVLGYYSGSDGGEGLFWYNSSDTTSADNSGTIIVDANNRRWYRQTGQILYSVKWFGAYGDNTHDDTVAVNATIAWVESQSGGIVWFPAGTFKLTNTLAITGQGITLGGSNKGATTLAFTGMSTDCITAIGTSGSYLLGITIENMQLTHPGVTGGRSIAFEYCLRFKISNVLDTAPYTGWEIYLNNDGYIENVVFQGIVGGSGANFSSFGPAGQKPTACYGIFWHGPSDGSSASIQLTTSNVTVSAIYSGADGFVWDGDASTWNMFQTSALNCRYGLWIRNTAASSQFYPTFLQAFGFNTDGMIQQGLRIEGGSQFQITNSEIVNTSGSTGQGGADTNAVYIAADVGASFTNAVWINNSRIGLSAQSAIYCAGRNVIINGCFIEPGETTPANTYAAVHVAAPAQDILINVIETNEWGGPVDIWTAGVLVDDGTFRVSVTSNIMYQPTVKGVIWNNNDAGSQDFGNVSPGAPAGPSYDPAPTMLPAGDPVGGNYVIPAAHILGGVYVAGGTPGAPFTATTDTAANLVAALPSPVTGKGLFTMFINGSGQNMTIAPGSGVTFNGVTSGGNYVLAAGSVGRTLAIRFNDITPGSESVTVYG
jgi:hypothetical protein